MSVEGCALQLLRACNVHPQQLILILQPFGGLMPATEAQLQLLAQQLLRQGHLTEGAPGNVATILNGPLRQARPGAYLTDQERAMQEGIPPNAAPSQSAYWGHTMDLRQPAAHTTDWQTEGRDSPDLSSAWWGAAASASPDPAPPAYPDSCGSILHGRQ